MLLDNLDLLKVILRIVDLNQVVLGAGDKQVALLVRYHVDAEDLLLVLAVTLTTTACAIFSGGFVHLPGLSPLRNRRW